ncbi:D-Ala-D-Ala carboxypeptidase family metallohydrolase [Kiloniella sp. EL199]|uniref:D-Ala-D-Ala carboxypeptidase family metallohydrolase n=1 Tax=Kiloniella sp. EL199 TaxID=2107581 RepID=UPI000EA03682|nr:D-Ala-D-Ala carboxypeptidase family metallohydrolase [Kiloniella sp. EL199]
MPLNWSDYSNFSASEFICKCGCGRADMNPEFMVKLQELRDRIGPLVITSGFRCKNHPVEKGKKRPGAHSAGLAADIIPLKARRYELLTTISDMRFKGIGVAKSFIHIDEGHPYAYRPASWSY